MSTNDSIQRFTSPRFLGPRSVAMHATATGAALALAVGSCLMPPSGAAQAVDLAAPASARVQAATAAPRTHTIRVWTSGGQAAIDACKGAVKMAFGNGHAVIAQHNYCGGSLILTINRGDTIRLTGVVAGTYRAIGFKSVPRGSTSAVLVGMSPVKLVLQTCHFNSNQMRLVALDKVAVAATPELATKPKVTPPPVTSSSKPATKPTTKPATKPAAKKPAAKKPAAKKPAAKKPAAKKPPTPRHTFKVWTSGGQRAIDRCRGPVRVRYANGQVVIAQKNICGGARIATIKKGQVIRLTGVQAGTYRAVSITNLPASATVASLVGLSPIKLSLQTTRPHSTTIRIVGLDRIGPGR